MERGWKPNVDISPNCPRCGCSNTKFCYYNNYSLTQPRYFCKGCRRYWTKGGSLRNVPVGGGCRKNRRVLQSLRLSTAAANDGVRYNSHGNFLADQYPHSTTTTTTTTTTSSSSVMPDGSHIDLALVYANFLNQKPDSKSNNIIGSEIPELQSDDHHFDPCLEYFPSMSSHDINGVVGSQALHPDPDPDLLSAENCGYFDTFHKNRDGIEKFCENQDGNDDFGLPPLPGQEIVATDHQEMLWTSSSCDHMMMDGHDHDHDYGMMQARQPLGPEAQDQNLLIGSWSPFDLPISCDILSPQHEIKKI